MSIKTPAARIYAAAQAHPGAVAAITGLLVLWPAGA